MSDGELERLFALSFALDLYGQPAHWARLMRNGMSQDFSWQRRTGEYLAVYRRLIGD